MTDAEYANYLSLIQASLGQRLGIGESATLAVAHSRTHAVVMDENKGRRYLANNFPSVPVVSTLTLLISATVRLRRDHQFLRAALDTARDKARMAVPKTERALLAAILEGPLQLARYIS